MKNIFDDVGFENILERTGQYGLIWVGTYLGKKCIIKMVKIYGKYLNINHNDNSPYLHKKFKNLKFMSVKNFLKEADALQNLSQLKLAPNVYGYWICEKYKVRYGFIVMEKMTCSLKYVLLKRSLYRDEKKLVARKINELHGHGIVHGDMKPSNIGVDMDKKRRIAKCVFLDCQKIKHRFDCYSDEFEQRVENDWFVYKNHFYKNKYKDRYK